MSFVLRMAWRETRASWARLLFFFLCVALGVGAIVLLRSVVQNVRLTLTREARSLVGADLVVQSSRPWTPELTRRVDEVLQTAPPSAETTVIDTQTMARAPEGQGTGTAKLVEIRAVEAAFPYYGVIELEGGILYSHTLLAGHGLVAEPALLADLGLAVGQSVLIAGRPFTIRGVIARDRVQRAGGIAFGPRVYIDLADLRATSLLGFGARATHQRFLRVDEAAMDGLVDRLKEALKNQMASVRSWHTLEDRLGRSLVIAENYLSLVGFAIVVIGGIGVWSVTRVIVQQKTRSIAILKCLGASSGRILGVYVLQVSWLAACGSVLGVALAAGAARLIPQAVLTSLGVTSVSITVSAAVQGVLVGLLVSLLFALVPLLEMRDVKPLLLLRADTASEARKRGWQSAGAGAGVTATLVLVAIWQANSLTAGLYVCVGLGVIAGVLYLASRVLIRAAAPLAASRHFAVRHAALSVIRPGNQTRVILMAVGLGCFFILSVRALQANLLAEFGEQLGQNWPDLVLIDVQRDQVESVRQIAAPFVRQPATLLPQVRARIVAINGNRTKLPTLEAIREKGPLAREFTLTYRDGLERNETLTAGTFWTSRLETPTTADGVDTEVSVAVDLHDDFGIDIGDEIRFDAGGRALRTRVTSIRDVAWSDEQNGGFVFVLRPGVAVDRTPHNFLGFVQLSADPRARNDLQRALATHPNVTIIDVRDVLARIREVVGNASLGITVVGAVTLAGGLLILIGAVAMTKFQKVYETAIYRTLGASARLIAMLVAIEYGVLGALAGSLGAIGAFGLSWGLARFLFEIDWRPAPFVLLGGVAATAVGVSLVGLVASLDVLVRKPLAALRG